MFQRIRILGLGLMFCLTMITMGAARAQSGSMTYGVPIKGALTESVKTVTYTLAGAKGDVVAAYIAAKASTTDGQFNPSFEVKDNKNSLVVDSSTSSNSGYMFSDANGSFFYKNYIFVLSTDGNYTIVIGVSQDGQTGTFTLTANKAKALTAAPITDMIDPNKLPSHEYGAAYVVNSITDFTVKFKQTSGAGNITAMISVTDPSGDLKTVGVIGGLSPDPFSPQANSAFLGGSLSIKGSALPYVVTIGNYLNGYDENLSNGKEPLGYQLILGAVQ